MRFIRFALEVAMLSDRLARRHGLRWSFSGLLAVAIASGCQPQPKLSPELEQAVDAARSMTSQRWLSRSAFTAVYPQARPSEYVSYIFSYIFSDLGAAEWPLALDPLEAEQLRPIGVTPLPPNVALVPQQLEPTRGKQLVLRADDAAGLGRCLRRAASGGDRQLRVCTADSSGRPALD